MLVTDHTFNTYAKISEKPTSPIPKNTQVRTRAYQGVRNDGFAENCVYVLNEFCRIKNKCHIPNKDKIIPEKYSRPC